MDATQDVSTITVAITNNFLAPFRALLAKLNDTTVSSNIPPVTCIVSDVFMPFTITAAEELAIPIVMFVTMSACGFMGLQQLRALKEKGLTPVKDENSLRNGFLETNIDRNIPGMKDMQLKDFPLVQTTNPNDFLFHFSMEAPERAIKATAILVHTLNALEQDVLHGLSSIFPSIYPIGPLQLLLNQNGEDGMKSIGYSLWKDENESLQWLDTEEPKSVVCVNFGSVIVMTAEQLVELAMGLANNNYSFLWIIRPDLVIGDSAILPVEFEVETKKRGFIASWCPQREVLNHPSFGGFLTHCGWGSTLESLSAGVPIVCWPFLADQQMNCKYTCKEWAVGMEIGNNVKRDQVEKLVGELMEGDKGKKVREKAMEWKKIADEATGPNGSSCINLDKWIHEVLFSNN